MSGGSVSYLSAFDSSIINITGGSIGNLSAYNSSTINIYGTDLFLSETGGNRGGGYITGIWIDGTLFTMSLFDHPRHVTPGDTTYNHINLNWISARFRNNTLPGILSCNHSVFHRTRYMTPRQERLFSVEVPDF